MNVSIDTGIVYIFLGPGDWHPLPLTIRELHQKVHQLQPQHDSLSDREKEDLYDMTNILLFMQLRYDENLQKRKVSGNPLPTGTIKPPRF